MTLRTAFLVCCVASLLGALGCGLTDTAPPVATPAVGLNRTRVPLGGPLGMTYRFTVPQDAPAFSDDYRVFVHFLDADGSLMFEDDHDPPEPTTSWRLGQEIAYERRFIVPVYPYIGEATIAVGLYSEVEGDRLQLAGDHLGGRAYRVATMEMAPQSESGFLMFEDGWHAAEAVPEEPSREWQWTTGRATISFRNPGTDSTLYLEVGGRPALFDTPQMLTLAIDDTVDRDDRDGVCRAHLPHHFCAGRQSGECRQRGLDPQRRADFCPVDCHQWGEPRRARAWGSGVLRLPGIKLATS